MSLALILACQPIDGDGGEADTGGRAVNLRDSKVEDLADLARDARIEDGSTPPSDAAVPDAAVPDAAVPDAAVPDGAVGGLPDFTGVHLLAVATFIDSDRPLLFKADVVLVPNSSPTTDDASTLSVALQALRCQYEQVCDKVPVGPVLPPISARVRENGEFLLDLGQVTLPGEANPISGRPITATLQFAGAIRGETLACGVVRGQIFDPIMAPLDGTGSTFALTKQGVARSDVDFLAAPVVKACDAPAPDGQ